MKCNGSSTKRVVYGNTCLSQKQKKHQINNLTLHLKRLKENKTPTKLVGGNHKHQSS